MPIIDNIQQRKSVRSYRKEYLSSDDAAKIRKFIEQLEISFGAKLRIELIRTKEGPETRKFETYGVVRGAADFLVVAHVDGPLAEEAVGYAFEQVVLYCTETGLGTCWIGGTFNRSDFAKAVSLQPHESLSIISPVGYKAEKKSFIEAAMTAVVKSHLREDFGTLFFGGSWDYPLTPEEAGVYKIPLEMVRLAPSARNKQPWRVLVKDGEVHFYRHPEFSRFTRIDMGIALCHFEQTCTELGIEGKLTVLPSPPQAPEAKGVVDAEYTMSWTIRSLSSN